MPTHEHDENKAAPNQHDTAKPTDPTAARAPSVSPAPKPRRDKRKPQRRPTPQNGSAAFPRRHLRNRTLRHPRHGRQTHLSKHSLKINQKDGFDCPSCAWPDPDHDRHTAEFSRERAKAVASEATTARATPEFFAQHSIPEMLQQSDLWLDQQGRITHPMIRRPWFRPLPTHRLGRSLHPHRQRTQLLSSPNEALPLLHLRTSAFQRSRLPLRTLRPTIRHQQPPRLLQHVPRILRHRSHPHHRHRKMHHQNRRPRTRRCHLHHRSKPRHSVTPCMLTELRVPHATIAKSSPSTPRRNRHAPLQKSPGTIRHARHRHKNRLPLPPTPHQRRRRPP